MTTIYDIHSYKGGTGVTTTACATALALSKEGKKTLLVNAQGTHDTEAWLGLSDTSGIYHINDTLTHLHGEFGPYASEFDAVVVDNGRNTGVAYPAGFAVVRVCVVRNDYMTLRNTVARRNTPAHFVPEEDAFVLLYDPNITLSDRDVRAVISQEPIVVNMDPQVQRSIDAGLAMTRPLFGWAEEIAQMVGVL